MKNNHGFSNTLVISIALVLIGVGGYFGFRYFQNTETAKSVAQNTDNKPTQYQPAQLQKENENLKYLKAAKINSDLNLTGSVAFKSDAKESEYYLNEKQELFLDYVESVSPAVAKLQNGKWVKIISWNGYPNCKTFDNAGVPFKKSTIDYGCVLDTKGQPVRASLNKADSIEYCKVQFKRFGSYSESPLEINCKKLMQ